MAGFNNADLLSMKLEAVRVVAAVAVMSRLLKALLRCGVFGDLGGVNKPTDVLSSLSTAKENS